MNLYVLQHVHTIEGSRLLTRVLQVTKLLRQRYYYHVK